MKKNIKDTKEVKTLKIKFILLVLTVDFLAVLLSYLIMPSVQGFPPYTENFAFQNKVQKFTHLQQYSIVFLIGITIHLISFKLLMKKIYTYMNKYYRKESISIDEIRTVRKDCINIPFKVFIFQMLLIVSIGIIFNFIMLANFFSIIKFTLMMLSLSSLISILLLISTQKFLYKIILTTYNITNIYEQHNGFRIKYSTYLLMQVIPFIAVVLFIVCLIGYSKTVQQKGFASANFYKAYLLNKDIQPEQVNEESLKSILDSIPLLSNKDYYFIIHPNDEIIYVSNPDGYISDFVLAYRDFFSDRTNGILYEKFGTDEQLYSLKLADINNNIWYVGFKYPVIDINLLTYYLSIMLIVIITYSTLFIIISKNLSDNASKIGESLKNILNTDSNYNKTILPITSNDEFGNLAYYYNKIQELTIKNIEKIHSNQDLLMEKERLASLGQLIGGIAHNLKTPIMSISGASEGLKDLIHEYDISIDDPEVNSHDHHEIAQEMSSWVSKIKTHTEYMSDVITAVKGQAVALSAEKNINFTIEELIKRVTILMRHELKNALIDLNINMQVSNNLTINGDINSLVQVINNMISNAIQAYNGKTNEVIDFILSTDNKNLIISIRDYGCGMNDNVKSKLFKEMITTKGKNGTGLGLFMSYSNIRAHFNGNITFDSTEGKGTTFFITIPI